MITVGTTNADSREATRAMKIVAAKGRSFCVWIANSGVQMTIAAYIDSASSLIRKATDRAADVCSSVFESVLARSIKATSTIRTGGKSIGSRPGRKTMG